MKRCDKNKIIIVSFLVNIIIILSLFVANDFENNININGQELHVYQEDLGESTWRITGNWYKSNDYYSLKLIVDDYFPVAFIIENNNELDDILINNNKRCNTYFLNQRVFKINKEIIYLQEEDFIKTNEGYEVELSIKYSNEKNTPILYIGNIEPIYRKYMMFGCLDFITIGISVVCFFIALSLFKNTKEEKYLYYTAGLSLVNLFRNIMKVNVTDIRYILNISPILASKIDALLLLVSGLLISYIFYEMFKIYKEENYYFIYGSVAVTTLFAIVFVVFNIYYIEVMISIFFILVLIWCLYNCIRMNKIEQENVMIPIIMISLHVGTIIFEGLTKAGIVDYGLINRFLNITLYSSVIFNILLLMLICQNYSIKYSQASKLKYKIIGLEEKYKKALSSDTIGLQKSNEKLVDAYTSLNSFQEKTQNTFYSISNELKEPMSVIRGYIDAMREGQEINLQTRQKYLDKIYSKIDFISEIINDLHLIAILEGDDVKFNKTFVELNVFVNFTLKDFVEVFKDKNIELSTDLDISRIMIDIDKSMTYTVIDKILKFFIDSMNKGGNIIVGTIQCNDNRAILFFRIIGSSISYETLDTLLNEYNSKDYNNENKSNTMGLGLYMAKSILIKQGGDMNIEVKSNGEIILNLEL